MSFLFEKYADIRLSSARTHTRTRLVVETSRGNMSVEQKQI